MLSPGSITRRSTYSPSARHSTVSPRIYATSIANFRSGKPKPYTLTVSMILKNAALSSSPVI